MPYVETEDGGVREVSVDEWARGTPLRHVAITRVGTGELSTVFLGIDHGHMIGGPPVLYETMWFDDGDEPFCLRWCTCAEALAGHDKVADALAAGAGAEEAFRRAH